MRRVCHLIDDTQPGGVVRFLDFLRASPDMAALGSQEVRPVATGPALPPRLDADVIVSHVVLSWRNLPFFLALRARHPRTPLVHMEHSYSPAFADLYVTKPGRFAAMLRASLRLFDRVITISTTQRDWLAAQARLPAAKLHLIPPCVALDAFLALTPATGPLRRIGAIGRLDPQKGFDILIDAFRMAGPGEMMLEIFGDGPERADLLRRAAGDPRIRFHGHVADPVAAMAAVDAIAMPSRREPYGLVALEALAGGRTLLVSRADGLIDHARNGAISVPDLTAECWAGALSMLPSQIDPEALARARREAASAEQRMAAGWRALLETL